MKKKANKRPQHARPDSKTGLIGAHSDGRGKYSSKIMYRGKRIHLGHFPTPEEAHERYIREAEELGLLPVS